MYFPDYHDMEIKCTSRYSKYPLYLFTSDLKRTIDSAVLAFSSLTSTQDERLRECNYGYYNGEDKKTSSL